MTDLLRAIMEERKADARRAMQETPLEALRTAARAHTRRSLAARLALPQTVPVVAEMKKASPSAGLLRESYRPGPLAVAYAQAGAAGLSVLTEPRRFLGSGAHLREVRAAVDLPVLRKDFLCDPYQVAESAAWGADVILIILAALTPAEARGLYDAALAWDLEALVEAHTEAEVEFALELEQALVGVNSRDLKTLKTDLNVARRLAALIPPARLSIAESGLRRPSDMTDLQALGYNGFLVGEAFMRQPRPADILRAWLRSDRSDA